MSVHLSALDWGIIGGLFLLTFLIGVSCARVAGKSRADFFIGGRSMPWWLLGFSMVATTFSTDTPNLVCNFVREYGICGNWQWWAMLPSGMLTVFLYARLWRRSQSLTDLEFYEMRYSGRLAAFLRGFRAIYLGFLFDIIVMASVTLAAIKIGGAMLNLTPIQSVLGAMIITAVFSSIGGLRGVLLSDFFLFLAAMTGAVAAAYFSLMRPEVGGVDGLLEKLSASSELFRKTELLGFGSPADWMALFIIPFTVIWWSVWYPGAEPGGGGYLVQRMLAAKNERHALGATLFFNIAHYALRPWPWMLVALCSLVIYPDRASLVAALQHVLPEHQIQGDVAYSLMLATLPAGWIGLVVASLAAAYVSTISTQLNWGASYLVNDFYGRFIRPSAPEKEMVWMGRLFTVLLMLFSGLLALYLDSALESFNILLSIGAGTGLIFMLRWFWWRINAAAELTAMIASFLFAIYFNILHARLFPDLLLSGSESMVLSVALTTVAWLIAAWFGPGTDRQQLYRFCRRINPAGPGWNAIRRAARQDGVDLEADGVPRDPLLPGILAAVACCIGIYAALYGTGALIYGNWLSGTIAFAVGLLMVWPVIRFGFRGRD